MTLRMDDRMNGQMDDETDASRHPLLYVIISLKTVYILVKTWNWTRPTVHGRAPFIGPLCLFRQ